MFVTLSGIIVPGHPTIKVLLFVWIIALQLLRESYTALPSATCKEVRLLQPLNTQLPTLVTLAGIVMEVRLLQPQKARSPILVTPSGMVMEVRPYQPSKALPPMLVTFSGMTVLEHPTMRVLLFVWIIALQLLRESYTALPSATFKEVRLLQ